jgi:uncharacterized membrane protein YoaK (UPF0700 family)
MTIIKLVTMFRHSKPRAFIHDLRLASMLSFVAGIVNITGVLSIKTLTTNVTGHFAFFAEEFVRGEYRNALTYVLFVLCFFAGAITCNFLIEVMIRRKVNAAHALPMMLEMVLLAIAAVAAVHLSFGSHTVANILLFSMGLQNALVTKVSQATVRTTHLTGLFTDLGIEVSQLFFFRAKSDLQKLKRSIYLRLAIIAFFFLGGMIGGFIYLQIDLNVLYFASVSILIALMYDNMRLSFHYYKRKFQSRAE